MRIQETPTREHIQLLQIEEPRHISSTGKHYIIRKTRAGWTYYYGAYKDKQAAEEVNEQLQMRGYPPTVVV